MSRNVYFNSPFLLGFEPLERLLERTAKAAGDGYPPYNIEEAGDDRLRITLAVAGFSREELQVTLEEKQLVIRGKQSESTDKNFLHRGIAPVSARIRAGRRNRGYGCGTRQRSFDHRFGTTQA